MSLLKYLDEFGSQQTSQGKPIGVSRALTDGMPYRGPQVAFKPGEFEQFTSVVYDSHVQQFDLGQPEEQEAYRRVIEGVVNGRYLLHSRLETPVPQPDGSIKLYAFATWSEPWRELDTQRAKHLLGT
jgi:hypothetical protein